MKLNPNAKKWVKALESGEFKQTTGRLADKDGYCCLGVLCEVAIANGVRVKKQSFKNGKVKYDSQTLLPPNEVVEWVGLNESDGSFDTPLRVTNAVVGGDYTDLTGPNDDQVPFKKIAKIIRERAEEIFNV